MSEELPIVYLARHGETAWTISGQYTGRTDLPLTERGERNAAQLGERLKGLTFDKVFCSPLQRARRTCELAGFGSAANIAKAAASTTATAGATAGLPPAQAAMATMSAQQLVMTEVSALSSQLSSENSGIWKHLWHVHHLATTGAGETAAPTKRSFLLFWRLAH